MRPGCTWETVLDIARELPSVEESISYRTSALRFRKKLMARLKEDGESLVLIVGFDNREILMQSRPDAFYFTDHYRDYPSVLVHLSRVTREELRDVLALAYECVKAKK